MFGWTSHVWGHQIKSPSRFLEEIPPSVGLAEWRRWPGTTKTNVSKESFGGVTVSIVFMADVLD